MMSKQIQAVSIIVVDTEGNEYDVSINPEINDSELAEELFSRPDFNLNAPQNYKIRRVI